MENNRNSLAIDPDISPTDPGILREAQRVLVSMLCAIKAICEAHGIEYWLDSGTLLGAVRHKGFIPWDDDIDIVMPRADYEKFLEVAPNELPRDMYVQTRDNDLRLQLFNFPCKLRDLRSRIRELDMPVGVVPDLGLFVDIVPLDRFHRSGIGKRLDSTLKWSHYKLCVYLHAEASSRRNIRTLVGNIFIKARPFLGVMCWLRWYRTFLVKVASVHNNTFCDCGLIGYGFDSKISRYFDTNDIFPLQRLLFEGHFFSAPYNTDAVLKMFYGNYMRIPPPEERTNVHFAIIEMDARDI